jgi:hypothetical protein
MLISSFWLNWFVVDFTYFKLNVGWFAVVYAGLLAYRNLMIKEHIQLTSRELHDWGDVLTRSTPFILEQARRGVRPRDIASKLETQESLPPVVSLKYMAALTAFLKKSDGEVPGHPDQVVQDKSDSGSQDSDQQDQQGNPSS